jgi:GT2 family glycosyltransferase
MRLSVVIVNWNSVDDLRGCLRSMAEQTHRDLELIVVDNGSVDGSPDMVRQEFPHVTLLAETENLGFAEACNRGIRRSSASWVVMLNNDTVALPEWAEALADAARDAEPTCGMLQSLMLFQSKPDTINSTGIQLQRGGRGIDRHGGQPNAALPADAIFCPTAGAAAYRRAMLDAIELPTGYFDSSYFMYYEDMDLGWRARLSGWSARFVPGSVVLHRYHGSSDRHGQEKLLIMSTTNRLRTVLKNASVPYMITSSNKLISDVRAIGRVGSMRGLVELFRALRGSLPARRRVSRMAKKSRRAIEHEWSVTPGKRSA